MAAWTKECDLLARPALRLELLRVVTQARCEARVAEAWQRAIALRRGHVGDELLFRSELRVFAAGDAGPTTDIGLASSRAVGRSGKTPLILERSPPRLRVATASKPPSR